jgi:hypothetical protein
MEEQWKLDVLCLMCGRLMGTVDIPGEHAPVPVQWHQARCAACGGAPMRGDAYVEKRLTLTLAAKEYAGLQGRPPRWLQKLRRETAERLGAA